MVFLTLVCLPDEGDWPEPLWVSSAAASAWLTAAGVVAVTAYAWYLARRARRALESDPVGRDIALARYERGRSTHRVLVFATYAGSLFLLGWGRAAYWLWGASGGQPWPDIGGQAWSGAELLLLTPFLLSLLLSWACFYDADRAAHGSFHRILGIDQHSREWLDRYARSIEPGTPFGGRLAYVLFHLRQKMALVFIPLSLLLVMKEVRRHLRDSWSGWEVLIDVAGLALVFIGMPWLVRMALGLRSLPVGPLKARLLATARRLRFRFSDVLLWDTRGGMANAMVIGVFPWPRYVVFTDRLISEFSPDEVEAVFGHEAGHVKHRHLLKYLLFLSGSILVLWLAWERLEPLLQYFPAAASWLVTPLQHSHQFVQMLPPAGLMLGYVFLVFGFLSRKCERQADVYGCRAVSCSREDCPGHDCGGQPADGGRGPCPYGIRTFVRALEKVAELNNISRDRPGYLQSWQHSTIARRVDFLESMLVDPGAERRFQRQVTALKWSLFVSLALLLALVLHFGTVPPDAQQSNVSAAGMPAVSDGASDK
jgi:Zn-dependent protease with chaperone function